MLTYDKFRESVRLHITPEQADDARLRHFYATQWGPGETVAFIKRGLLHPALTPR